MEQRLPFWIKIKDGNEMAYAIYQRHYSARKYKEKRQRLFVGPGEKLVLMGINYNALFVWRKFIDASGQNGVNCAVFRNESKRLSSDLIIEAEEFALRKWGLVRLYTYVNAKKIKSTNPGFCFLVAGWSRCGVTKNGLIILDKHLIGPKPPPVRHDAPGCTARE